MNNERILLGVLGGLGPMSTVYFCELLTAHTKAATDADHIDMLISSRASTPDRTSFILGKSTADPLPVMRQEALRLQNAGANLLVIPCNTAHYFYDGLKKACDLPILNIIEETVSHLAKAGTKVFGLLATEGTVRARSYERICQSLGMTCLTPDREDQAFISGVIYDAIKQNKPVDQNAFLRVANKLIERGCERLVLGCTELSLLKKEFSLPDDRFVDSLEVLAFKTILACHKEPIGFPATFERIRKGELV